MLKRQNILIGMVLIIVTTIMSIFIYQSSKRIASLEKITNANTILMSSLSMGMNQFLENHTDVQQINSKKVLENHIVGKIVIM